MNELLDFLIKNEFCKCGKFLLDENGINGDTNTVKIQLDIQGCSNDIIQTKGIIYLWVLVDKQDAHLRVIYVGSSKDTIKKRISTHNGGFKRINEIGFRRNALKILEHLKLKNKVFVFCKKSKRETFIIGNMPIDTSICEAEESAYQEYFNRLYRNNNENKLISELRFNKETQSYI